MRRITYYNGAFCDDGLMPFEEREAKHRGGYAKREAKQAFGEHS